MSNEHTVKIQKISGSNLNGNDKAKQMLSGTWCLLTSNKEQGKNPPKGSNNYYEKISYH